VLITLEFADVVARVHALRRRRFEFAVLHCADLEIDPMARLVNVAGTMVRLTNREHAMLLHLVRNSDRIVSRSELLAHVWGGFDAAAHWVETHIGRLRSKLVGCRATIETIGARGYRVREGRAIPNGGNVQGVRR